LGKPAHNSKKRQFDFTDRHNQAKNKAQTKHKQNDLQKTNAAQRLGKMRGDFAPECFVQSPAAGCATIQGSFISLTAIMAGHIEPRAAFGAGIRSSLINEFAF
jgi:hypothetical protein